MTKNEQEDWIEQRIKSEYKKHGDDHKDLDWAKIAAKKIKSSLEQEQTKEENRVKDEVVEFLTEYKEQYNKLGDSKAITVLTGLVWAIKNKFTDKKQ